MFGRLSAMRQGSCDEAGFGEGDGGEGLRWSFHQNRKKGRLRPEPSLEPSRRQAQSWLT